MHISTAVSLLEHLLKAWSDVQYCSDLSWRKPTVNTIDDLRGLATLVSKLDFNYEGEKLCRFVLCYT